jgi:hypothetical protein
VIKIEFQWTRAFSKTAGERAYEHRGGKIIQTGRGKQAYAPLANQALYLEFARLDPSPASCVEFAEKWGLLLEPAKTANPPSEDLTLWRNEIRKMKYSIEALPRLIRVVNARGTFANVSKVDVLLVPGAGTDARPVMVLEPPNLLQAMNLQLAHAVSSGASLLTCQQCRRWFEGGRGPGAKRTVAKFCSDECRNRFHYEARKGAAQ